MRGFRAAHRIRSEPLAPARAKSGNSAGQTRKYIVVQSVSLHRSEPPYVRASASLARFALQL
jgi:hypothetical protein